MLSYHGRWHQRNYTWFKTGWKGNAHSIKFKGMLIAMQPCNRRLGKVAIEINDGINMDFDMESTNWVSTQLV